MKKLLTLLIAAMALLPLSVSAQTVLPTCKPIEGGYPQPEKKVSYMGKVLLTPPLPIPTLPTGIYTVHGVYFNRADFYLGIALSADYLFDRNIAAGAAIHPEYYFRTGKKVDWSVFLDIGAFGVYYFPDHISLEDKDYWSPGFWEKYPHTNLAPGVAIAINFSDDIALDIGMRINIVDFFSYPPVPLFSVGIRF